MKIYLAGKIAKNDWRHELVPDVGGNHGDPEEWENACALPMVTGDTYVGPFFIRCDHGCYHGDNCHGAGHRLHEVAHSWCVGEAPLRSQVREKAVSGIKNCDLFIAYMGLDFNSAFGTMAEIGVAHAWGKQIILIVHPELDTKDFWFLKTMASFVVKTDNPVQWLPPFLAGMSLGPRS